MYEIKCDECKTAIGETDSASISAAGGLCHACKTKISKLQQRARFKARIDDPRGESMTSHFRALNHRESTRRRWPGLALAAATAIVAAIIGWTFGSSANETGYAKAKAQFESRVATEVENRVTAF